MTKFEDIINWNKQNGIEVSVKHKKQIAYELIGQIVPHNNHKIWEVDDTTLEVREAIFTTATAVTFGAKVKKEIIVKNNCSYVSALNKANALKKYKNGVSGTRNVWKELLKF